MFLTESNQDPVLSAIVYLASLCNGASTVDGQGFNKHDTEIGCMMAAQINRGEKLSSVDYKRCERFVKKYRKQLTQIEEYVEAVECEVTDDEPLPAQEINVNKANLNNQQIRAFDGICEWVRGGTESGTQALLKGYAGTGKTYTIQRIAKELQKDRIKICFSAPTHKAVKVLRGMAFDADLRVHCETINRLLGTVVETNSDGEKYNKQINSGVYFKYDLVVVDECSMIGNDLYQYIPKFCNTKFLFMGDPAQLPPTETKQDKKDLAGNLLSPCFSVDLSFELTEVVRNKGLILKYVTDVRENLEFKKLPPRQYNRREFEALPSEEWFDEAVYRFKKAIESGNFKANPDLLRVLVWTNDRGNKLNFDFRTAVYGADIPPYIAGEVLIAKDLISVDCDPDEPDWKQKNCWSTGSSSTFMNSSDECIVLDSNQSVSLIDCQKPEDWDYWSEYKKQYCPTYWVGSLDVPQIYFASWQVTIKNLSGDIATVLIIDVSEKEKSIQYFNNWKKAILSIPNLSKSDKERRSKEWRRFYYCLSGVGLMTHKAEYIRRLQYGFVMTIHQSQGSTFETVFADISNVYGCQDIKLRNQLLYVQGSRASKELILLSKY